MWLVDAFRRLFGARKGGVGVEAAVAAALILAPMTLFAVDGLNRVMTEQRLREAAQLLSTSVGHNPALATDTTAQQALVASVTGSGPTLASDVWCACSAEVATAGWSAPARTCGAAVCSGAMPNRYARFTLTQTIRALTPLGSGLDGALTQRAAVRLPRT
jgi:Flp pilus assembly protein TadG